jgi:hypothetical protein
MVEGIYIKRDVWQKAIPTVVTKFHAVIDNFYPVGSNEAALLEKVLDLTNKLILEGDDSKASVSGSRDGEFVISLVSFFHKPQLTYLEILLSSSRQVGKDDDYHLDVLGAIAGHSSINNSVIGNNDDRRKKDGNNDNDKKITLDLLTLAAFLSKISKGGTFYDKRIRLCVLDG